MWDSKQGSWTALGLCFCLGKIQGARHMAAAAAAAAATPGGACCIQLQALHGFL